MKQTIFFIFFYLCFVGARAQHCPFDFSGIIVVKVHAAGDSAVIPNLRITLVDSVGNILMTQNWDGSAWKDDTLVFWQNPAQTTFKGHIDNENPADEQKIRFPFASNNYVLVRHRSFQAKNYKLKIEDIDGENNGGRFTTVIRQLTNEDVYRLCGVYAAKEYPVRHCGWEYRPVEIQATFFADSQSYSHQEIITEQILEEYKFIKDSLYIELIKYADNYFKQGNYNRANYYYSKILDIKHDEIVFKKNEICKDTINERYYNLGIEYGDNAFNNHKYEEAKSYYTNYRKYSMTRDQYIRDMLERIHALQSGPTQPVQQPIVPVTNKDTLPYYARTIRGKYVIDSVGFTCEGLEFLDHKTVVVTGEKECGKPDTVYLNWINLFSKEHPPKPRGTFTYGDYRATCKTCNALVTTTWQIAYSKNDTLLVYPINRENSERWNKNLPIPTLRLIKKFDRDSFKTQFLNIIKIDTFQVRQIVAHPNFEYAYPKSENDKNKLEQLNELIKKLNLENDTGYVKKLKEPGDKMGIHVYGLVLRKINNEIFLSKKCNELESLRKSGLFRYVGVLVNGEVISNSISIYMKIEDFKNDSVKSNLDKYDLRFIEEVNDYYDGKYFIYSAPDDIGLSIKNVVENLRKEGIKCKPVTYFLFINKG